MRAGALVRTFLVILLGLTLWQCGHPPPSETPPSGTAPTVQPPGEKETESPYNILDYKIDVRSNGILIELSLSEPLKYEWFLTDNEWINLSFLYGRLDPDRMRSSAPHPAVREVAAYQFDSSAQISFRMTRAVGKYIVTTDPYSPKRVLVMITDPGSGTLPSGAAKTAPKQMCDVIVIDPGHGGKDSGGMGAKWGTAEKNITRAIAERTATLFEKDSRFKVYLTRSEDSDVSLDARVRVAHASKADVLISIHTNSSRTAALRGAKTIFTGPLKRAKPALDSPERILPTATVAQTDPLPTIRKMPSGGAAGTSSELARLIQTELAASIELPGLGAQQRESPLLSKSGRTAVMILAGYISNSADEALLRKKSFQKKVAEAIYRGVVAYRTKLERHNTLASEQ